MRFKRTLNAFLAICITAILVIAVCGCEDLGAYEDKEEYYNSFDDVVLISGTSRNTQEYSIEEYFYNKESREDFLAGKDGAYEGVEYSDYVYMAIPFESDIDMDTLALFIQSQTDVSVYINVFVTDKIPSEWRPIVDNDVNQDQEGGSTDEETGEESEEEKEYDDPDPDTKIGEVVVHLEKGKWDSFLLDFFTVNGESRKSIVIKDGQYILLQFRNNSGVRVFDEEKQAYVDPQTGIELPKAEITMTNLLVRALDMSNGNEVQEGE